MVSVLLVRSGTLAVDIKNNRTSSVVVITAPITVCTKPYFTGSTQLSRTIAAVIRFGYVAFGFKASKVDCVGDGVSC